MGIEYNQHFDKKNLGANSGIISEEPDTCLVRLPKTKQHVVVSAGPRKQECGEFWSNVLSQDVRMIACLVEKCDFQYWPQEVGECIEFGQYRVTLKSKKNMRNKLVESNLEVAFSGEEGESQSANVSHIWFKGWKDFSIPEDKDEMAAFDEVVNMLTELICDESE